MRHHKKTRKRKGGAWLDPSSWSIFQKTPATPEQIVQDPTKVTTDAGNVASETVEEAASKLGVPTSSAPGGLPGASTTPEDAALLGGKRRRKTRRRKSRRKH